MIQFYPTGPSDAPIMIVGEAPGEREVQAKAPFVGPSGWELDKMLRQAGLDRAMCFVTNVCRERPPENDVTNFIAEKVKDRTLDHQEIKGKWVDRRIRFGLDLLRKEIDAVRPTLVIAFGNLALWALTGKWGIRKWRGSILQGQINGHLFKVIPIIHPAAILRDWASRRLVVHDLQRAAVEFSRGPIVTLPNHHFITAPTFSEACEVLGRIRDRLDKDSTPLKLAPDIETRGGHIACLGIAWSKLDAICIPFVSVRKPEGFYSLAEEIILLEQLRYILQHPNAYIVGQNWSYDQQYIWRRQFISAGLSRDTMLTQHSMYSVSQKGLDFLASLYCDFYRYWKDDGKKWDPSIPEDQYWRYNCLDCVYTYEVEEEQALAIEAMAPSWPKLPELEREQTRLQGAVMRMMIRGVATNETARNEARRLLVKRLAELQAEIHEIAGQELNVQSPKQMTDYFYTVLAQTPIHKRLPNGKRGNLSCDSEALHTIASREPILVPLISRIEAIRSGSVFRSTFLDMKRDEDGRMRSSYNVGGTKTYRFSSSENAFDSGGNLQNLSTGEADAGGEAVLELIDLPNVKERFVPDPGMTFFDLDGDSADLRIVTAESGCKQMVAYFAAGVKPYVEIAKEFYHDPTITKHHPSYRKMKALCHGSNYLGTPRGLSERIGLPVASIERMQKWYFGMCPEIRQWQEDIKKQITDRGYIENPFGYRCWFWDRVTDASFREGVAWIPQSTVANFINRILRMVDEACEAGVEPAKFIQLLMQVHDSLNGQFPTPMNEECKRYLKELAATIQITCKCATITIPIGIKTSEISWGHCK